MKSTRIKSNAKSQNLKASAFFSGLVFLCLIVGCGPSVKSGSKDDATRTPPKTKVPITGLFGLTIGARVPPACVVRSSNEFGLTLIPPEPNKAFDTYSVQLSTNGLVIWIEAFGRSEDAWIVCDQELVPVLNAKYGNEQLYRDKFQDKFTYRWGATWCDGLPQIELHGSPPSTNDTTVYNIICSGHLETGPRPSPPDTKGL